MSAEEGHRVIYVSDYDNTPPPWQMNAKPFPGGLLYFNLPAQLSSQAAEHVLKELEWQFQPDSVFKLSVGRDQTGARCEHLVDSASGGAVYTHLLVIDSLRYDQFADGSTAEWAVMALRQVVGQAAIEQNAELTCVSD